MAGSSHGHTPAAWTGVIIAFIGFCVSGAFMVMADPLGFWWHGHRSARRCRRHGDAGGGSGSAEDQHRVRFHPARP